MSRQTLAHFCCRHRLSRFPVEGVIVVAYAADLLHGSFFETFGLLQSFFDSDLVADGLDERFDFRRRLRLLQGSIQLRGVPAGLLQLLFCLLDSIVDPIVQTKKVPSLATIRENSALPH